MNDYVILVSGLKEGNHTNSFKIKDDFFQEYSSCNIESANINVDTVVKVKGGKTSLLIELKGLINNMLCDICAEELSIEIQHSEIYRLKKTNDEMINDSEDVIYLKNNENKICIKHLIFEMVILSIPKKIRHENKDSYSSCSVKMLELLEKYQTFEKQPDARWEKLKEIKTI